VTAYNIIFAGTPPFAATALLALLASEHTVKAVYTQPDRKAGRGQVLRPSAVKEVALSHHLPLHQPLSLKELSEQEKLKNIQADLMVVVAYGLILPKAILDAPQLGCINIHASLLPHHRGAAPIQRAILEGDEKTGITIMQMDEGLDTGPILYQNECPIYLDDTSSALQDRLAQLGADALMKTLHALPEIKPKKQENSQATYAHKISKEEAHIHWNKKARDLSQHIRAMNPWPIAYGFCGDMNIRIFECQILKTESHKKPGEIIKADDQGLDVATADHDLRILKMQLPGGKILPVKDILNSKRHLFLPGMSLN
jgi:methionyl-tRNA formyltransferase